MMRWLSSIRLALARIAAEPLASLFTLAALASAFGLSMTVIAWSSNAPGAGAHDPFASEATLYLKDERPTGSGEALAKRIRSIDGVTSVRLLPREESLQRLQSRLGEDLLSGLDGNPLPDAVIVRIAPELPLERVDALISGWRDDDIVDEVHADRELAQRIREIGRSAARLAHSVVLLLLLSSAVVVFNTIRLQLAGRQHEIELVRLLGAPASFVRRPFIAHGAVLGGLGAALGWGLSSLWGSSVAQSIAPLVSAWGLPAPAAALPTPWGLAALIAGGLLGGATAWLGVARMLRRIDAR